MAEEFSLSIGEMTIAARAWGPEGGLPVLGLHGWLDNAATFDRLAPLLPEIRLVAVDLPGHGRSDHRHPTSHYHFIDYVPDVAVIADKLGWERFNLMGHSMGAGIASLAAGTLVDRVERLVLIEGIGPMTTRAEQAPSQLQTAIESQRRLIHKRPRIYKSLEDGIEARMKSLSPLSKLAAERLVERGTREVDQGYEFRFDPRLRESSRMRLVEEQVLAFLKRIACPVLIVWADQGWPFDQALIDERLRQIATLEVVKVAGGHHVHLDNPESIFDSIDGFLHQPLADEGTSA